MLQQDVEKRLAKTDRVPPESSLEVSISVWCPAQPVGIFICLPLSRRYTAR
jgi:hypothetical protein